MLVLRRYSGRWIPGWNVFFFFLPINCDIFDVISMAISNRAPPANLDICSTTTMLSTITTYTNIRSHSLIQIEVPSKLHSGSWLRLFQTASINCMVFKILKERHESLTVIDRWSFFTDSFWYIVLLTSVKGLCSNWGTSSLILILPIVFQRTSLLVICCSPSGVIWDKTWQNLIQVIEKKIKPLKIH